MQCNYYRTLYVYSPLNSWEKFRSDIHIDRNIQFYKIFGIFLWSMALEYSTFVKKIQESWQLACIGQNIGSFQAFPMALTDISQPDLCNIFPFSWRNEKSWRKGVMNNILGLFKYRLNIKSGNIGQQRQVAFNLDY